MLFLPELLLDLCHGSNRQTHILYLFTYLKYFGAFKGGLGSQGHQTQCRD